MTNTIERYGFLNTHSHAGDGQWITINVDDVQHVTVWFNTYGNPTYMLYLKGGDTLLCVDDYGCMNGLNHLTRRVVGRKKDL